MKIALLTIFCIMSLTISSISVPAQKVMKLDEQLKANSTRLEVKRKGFGSVGKFQFGPYKIASGKAGISITKSKSKLFSLKTETETKQNSHFILVGHDTDSVIVKLSTVIKAKETAEPAFEITFGRKTELTTELENQLNKSEKTTVVTFFMPTDTTVWTMIIMTSFGEEVEGYHKIERRLTDGSTQIYIREITLWEDGSRPFVSPIGFEFYRDNQSIAAVQASPDTFKKKFVWLSNDLNEQQKLLFAAFSACLMICNEDGLTF